MSTTNPALQTVKPQAGWLALQDDPRVNEIVSGLYRRFKDWSQRGFSAEDVTWCEVKADVIRLITATPPAAIPAAPMTDECSLRDAAKQRWIAEDEDCELMEAYDRGWSDRAALAQPAPVQHNPELLLGWKRYEKLRKLSPAVFTRLHIANTTGVGAFDDLVDKLPEPSTPVPEAAPVQQEAATLDDATCDRVIRAVLLKLDAFTWSETTVETRDAVRAALTPPAVAAPAQAAKGGEQ